MARRRRYTRQSSRRGVRRRKSLRISVPFPTVVADDLPRGFFSPPRKMKKSTTVKLNVSQKSRRVKPKKKLKKLLTLPSLSDNLVRTVCKGRQVRKQIMHATGKAGKAGQKPPKWTDLSTIKC